MEIEKTDFVKITKMNHITELQYLRYRNTEPTILKINKDEYIHLKTGETRKFNHESETRADNLKSVAETMRKLRYLIRNNFTGGFNELMITNTYHENMTDRGRFYKDVDKFIKKMRYHQGPFDYLTVAEPQGRGAWHGHILTRWPRPIVLDNNSTIWKYWGHGITKTKRLNDVDDIGAYLSAYLGDMELSEAKMAFNGQIDGEIVEKVGDDGTLKKYVKGARLKLYPANMRIFRKSDGIVYPESEIMRYNIAKTENSLQEPSFRREYSVPLDETREQVVIYEHYNNKRKK